MIDLAKELRENSYPGRGIVLGRSADGKSAAIGYFIMGRSENSRNRIFSETLDGIRTEAFDPSKMKDPSLIIYAPVRALDETRTIVTNGDQTDTVYEGMSEGKSFAECLESREFEPDGPNYTPRISGLMTVSEGSCGYTLSILKSSGGRPESCSRFTFDYAIAFAGAGHFSSTYQHDGSPLPSFEGEPKLVSIPDTAEELADLLWKNLNEDNKVSLYVCYIDLQSFGKHEIIVNKNN